VYLAAPRVNLFAVLWLRAERTPVLYNGYANEPTAAAHRRRIFVPWNCGSQERTFHIAFVCGTSPLRQKFIMHCKQRQQCCLGKHADMSTSIVATPPYRTRRTLAKGNSVTSLSSDDNRTDRFKGSHYSYTECLHGNCWRVLWKFSRFQSPLHRSFITVIM
jgi:hypothetical protein